MNPYRVVSALIVVAILVAGSYYLYKESLPREEQDEPLEEYRPLLRRQPLVLKREDFRQLSPWQSFVTPLDPVVAAYAHALGTEQDAYAAALSWTWVSDTVLHGKEEQWIKPAVFIDMTPGMPTNPVSGMASDCEEQAYTLVSILRALGVPAEDVRVAVGLVDAGGGEQGGHAWVEIRYNGRWMQLEATSGPYWDEEGGQLMVRKGAPFGYYATHRYPVIEPWGYFNDIYYYNPDTKEGNAPALWKLLSKA
jgi:hypothetical protein